MARGRFFGGIHPPYHKELASGRAIEVMPLPARLIVHFAQNLGAAPKPVVKKGDAVKKGQVIAEPQGFVSVPLHAPTSGTVQAIDVFPHPVGADMPAAVVQQATMPQQRVVTGTLADLPRRVEAAGLRPPTLVIVGDVVKLRDTLNWYEIDSDAAEVAAVTP